MTTAPSQKIEPVMTPTTSAEYVNTLSHYYRGEMARMQSWRDRMDRTTNWAITVVAALLSVSLSTPLSHHGVLLFGMVLVYLLLVIESRRYRFFDVYRRRVRLVERNYYGAIFSADNFTEYDWMRELGRDIRNPQFYVTINQAMSRRLRRNYGWIFLILLLAWVLKTTTSMLQPKSGSPEFIRSTSELVINASIGYINGWLVILAVVGFYGWLGYIIFKHKKADGELSYSPVHV
ncbi:MAG TPA: DUF2270 domain-containing protein [Blastocatellia bacterium]|nr:DUF2270 domain-containing protein [Blastocatellia bacterium]